jgi:hypothetical protein
MIHHLSAWCTTSLVLNYFNMAFNKEELIQKIHALGFPKKEILLTFEEFFEGNTCEASIGVNVSYKPPVAEYRDTFKRLLDEKLADMVWIRIVDIEDPEEWIFTDTVYVIGDLTMEQLQDGIKNLHPDDIYEGWVYGEPMNVGEYDKSKNVYTIFWD